MNVQMGNGENFKIQQNLNCRSENVVYVMFCAGCDASYIGETGQPFHKQMDSYQGFVTGDLLNGGTPKTLHR